MKISCPACAAKYSIADEKVQDRLAKIRCRKCGTTIVIDGKVNPPSVTAGDAGGAAAAEDPGMGAAAGGGGEYSVDFGDNDQRTLTVAELVAAYQAGQVTTETFVWTEALGDWKPVSDVPELMAAFSGGSSPAAAPAPATPAPDLFASSMVPQPARAAARAGGRGSTADLFGGSGGAAAPADDDAGGGGDAPAAATGARNESSVLFSLSALTKAAPTPTASKPMASPSAPSAPRAAATREDSGLIDLKALTAQKPDAGSGADDALGMGGGGLGLGSPLGAPLGLGSPLGGAITAPANEPPKEEAKSKTGLYIGLGVVGLGMIAIAGAMVMKGGTPAPAPTVTVTVQAPAAPAPAAVTAAPPTTGTAEDKPADDKTAKPATGGTGPKPKAGPATAPGPGPKAAPSPDPAPAPKPAPAKTPCGCKAGDLQCAMKCAAGR